MNFKNIQAARDYLMANGYRFNGYGAMTQAEGYKNGDSVLFIRRARTGVVVR